MKLVFFRTTGSSQVFINPEHVVAIVSKKDGKSPTEIYTSTNLIYTVEGDWEEVKAKLTDLI